MKTSICLGVALGMIASTAVASKQPATEPKANKICRTEPSTGSYLRKKTCRTAEDWAQIDQANAKEADRFSKSRDGASGSIGSGSVN
jgi:hypothetical protein